MTPSLIDFESIKKFIVQIQNRSMSDPPLSDIDFKCKMDLGLAKPLDIRARPTLIKIITKGVKVWALNIA